MYIRTQKNYRNARYKGGAGGKGGSGGGKVVHAPISLPV